MARPIFHEALYNNMYKHRYIQYTILKTVENIHDVLILQLQNNNNNNNNNNSNQFLNHVREKLVLKYLH